MMSFLSAFLPNTIFYSRNTLEHSDEEKKRIHCMFEMIVCDRCSDFWPKRSGIGHLIDILLRRILSEG
jgi:hypothetical protein